MTNEEALSIMKVIVHMLEDKYDTDRVEDAVDMAIKALEQEPCEDCISRQAALNAMFSLCDTGETHIPNPYRDNPHIDAITDMLERLRSVTPTRPKNEWIPVSEELPEDIKPVIVTWKNTDPKSYYQYIVGKHFIGTAHYKNGKWFWYSSVTEDLLAEYGKCDLEEFDEAIEVVAWMPLPQPYKAEGRDEE